MAYAASPKEKDVAQNREEFVPTELVIARGTLRSAADAFCAWEAIEEHRRKTPKTKADERENSDLESQRDDSL